MGKIDGRKKKYRKGNMKYGDRPEKPERGQFQNHPYCPGRIKWRKK